MIYIVEDDAGIRDMMTYTLKSTGFEAEGFPSATPFWEALKKSMPAPRRGRYNYPKEA